MTVPDAGIYPRYNGRGKQVYQSRFTSVSHEPGSGEPRLAAGDAAKMKSVDLGPPLHILVVPGDLHIMEREYLEMFAGL